MYLECISYIDFDMEPILRARVSVVKIASISCWQIKEMAFIEGY